MAFINGQWVEDGPVFGGMLGGFGSLNRNPDVVRPGFITGGPDDPAMGGTGNYTPPGLQGGGMGSLSPFPTQPQPPAPPTWKQGPPFMPGPTPGMQPPRGPVGPPQPMQPPSPGYDRGPQMQPNLGQIAPQMFPPRTFYEPAQPAPEVAMPSIPPLEALGVGLPEAVGRHDHISRIRHGGPPPGGGRSVPSPYPRTGPVSPIERPPSRVVPDRPDMPPRPPVMQPPAPPIQPGVPVGPPIEARPIAPPRKKKPQTDHEFNVSQREKTKRRLNVARAKTKKHLAKLRKKGVSAKTIAKAKSKAAGRYKKIKGKSLRRKTIIN